MDILKVRLKNCLRTILELQPVMPQIYRKEFSEDFNRLRSYLNQADSMDLAEEEVARVETMTSAFIMEIRCTRSPIPATERLQ